jgi:hypothetical protein
MGYDLRSSLLHSLCIFSKDLHDILTRWRHRLVAPFADTCPSDPDPKTGAKLPNNNVAQSRRISTPSAAGQYLPGGDRYRGLLGNASGMNLRKDMTTSAWLREWEQKWQSIGGENKAQGKNHPLELHFLLALMSCSKIQALNS